MKTNQVQNTYLFDVDYNTSFPLIYSILLLSQSTTTTLLKKNKSAQQIISQPSTIVQIHCNMQFFSLLKWNSQYAMDVLQHLWTSMKQLNPPDTAMMQYSMGGDITVLVHCGRITQGL